MDTADSDLGLVLVTGATGFLGRALTRRLLADGLRVRGIGRRDLPEDIMSHPRFEFFRGDITDHVLLGAAMRDVGTVFHTAALVDLGWDVRPERAAEIRRTNVEGTQAVIEAARGARVHRLVQTSTTAVVSDGTPHHGHDESLAYSDSVLDLYTDTKITAERMILAADSEDLHTCALRPGFIYGPGEEQTIPRILEEGARGRLPLLIGHPDVRGDAVHVDDLVEAHIAAALRLVPGSPVCGSAYFVNDGEPVNYFELIRPVAEDLGVTLGTRWLDGRIFARLGAVQERIERRFGGPRPFLTPGEVRQLCTEQWHDASAARRDLAWEPRIMGQDGMRRLLPYARGLYAAMDIVEPPHPAWFAVLDGGLALLAGLVLCDGYGTRPACRLSSETTRRRLRLLLAGAILVHLAEAAVAWRLARRGGLTSSARGWAAQTLVVGFPSLRMLARRLRLRRGGAGP